jgi:cation diffusion facilitator family transporter
MTEFLIRHWVPNFKETTNPKVRTAYGKLASIVGIICNVFLFISKYIVGTLFGSIAIAADSVNNLSDASSNIVSLLGFKLGSKKPDEQHPYGHARYEYLSGLAVCVIILVIGVSLAKESVLKILHPEMVTFSWLSVCVLVVSILIKLWMSIFNRKIGEQIESDTLRATAVDSRNDVISTGAVLISTFLCKITGIMIIDGIIGLAVAVFILYSGIGLVQDTLSPLLGEAPDPKFVEYIEKKVCSYPNVLGVHDLIIHDYGPGNQFASIHVEFPAEENVLVAHDVVDQIEHDFLADDHLFVTVHYDPIVTANEEVHALRSYISEAVSHISPKISIHDLRIVPGNTHVNVLFDCAVPAGFPIPAKELKEQLKAIVRQKDPKYHCIIKMEQSFVPTDMEL